MTNSARLSLQTVLKDTFPDIGTRWCVGMRLRYLFFFSTSGTSAMAPSGDDGFLRDPVLLRTTFADQTEAHDEDLAGHESAEP
jgi:hypothetical protein